MAGSISRQTLQRLPLYLSCLKALPKVGPVNISATNIADKLGLNQVQVRKDLAAVSSGGRPKTGYITKELIADIEKFLGYSDADNVIIVGAGRLGKALMAYKGFAGYGIDIVAAFDTDEALIGTTYGNKNIFSIDKLENICTSLNVHIGVITVPSDAAQSVCDKLIDSGILAIWNFAPVHLNVPGNILVHNQNMAASLAVLNGIHMSYELFRKAHTDKSNQ